MARQAGRRFGGKNLPRLEGVAVARAEVERALHMTLDAAVVMRRSAMRSTTRSTCGRFSDGRSDWGIRMKSIRCQSDQGSRSVPR